jgi:hypothetical protein
VPVSFYINRASNPELVRDDGDNVLRGRLEAQVHCTTCETGQDKAKQVGVLLRTGLTPVVRFEGPGGVVLGGQSPYGWYWI